MRKSMRSKKGGSPASSHVMKLLPTHCEVSKVTPFGSTVSAPINNNSYYKTTGGGKRRYNIKGG